MAGLLDRARKLAENPKVHITLLDKNVYQQSQPLLYQVATVIEFRGSLVACRGENVTEGKASRGVNRRSLHCAPLDFLWRPVALMDFMRLSLRRAAHVALASSAK